MKDYVRMASEPTEAEMRERKEHTQIKRELLKKMFESCKVQWKAEHDQRWAEWSREFTKAGGNIAKLDRTVLARILGDAIQNFDYDTVSGISDLIAHDPELIDAFGLPLPIAETGWKRMKSGEAAKRMGISATCLGVWKKKHPDRVKSAGHGWCVVNPEYLNR